MHVNTRPLQQPGLESIKRPDGQALFDPVTRTLHALDATSMAIWEACDGTTTIDELTDAIAELGGIDTSESGRIVESALSELKAAGLIADN